MKYGLNVDEQLVGINSPTTGNMNMVTRSYFDNFQVKMNSAEIKNAEHLEVIKDSLEKAFQGEAGELTHHQTDGHEVFTLRLKQAVGPSLEELFMPVVRNYAYWLVQGMKKVEVCKDISYELDLYLRHVYSYSEVIRLESNENACSPYLTSSIKDQEIRIHFNTNFECYNKCFVDCYFVKMDVSQLTNTDIRFLKERFLYSVGEVATCMYGTDNQELIFAIKPDSLISFFQGIHELPKLLEEVVNDWENVMNAVSAGPGAEDSLDFIFNGESIPYVLEVSFVNIDNE